MSARATNPQYVLFAITKSRRADDCRRRRSAKNPKGQQQRLLPRFSHFVVRLVARGKERRFTTLCRLSHSLTTRRSVFETAQLFLRTSSSAGRRPRHFLVRRDWRRRRLEFERAIFSRWTYQRPRSSKGSVLCRRNSKSGVAYHRRLPLNPALEASPEAKFDILFMVNPKPYDQTFFFPAMSKLPIFLWRSFVDTAVAAPYDVYPSYDGPIPDVEQPLELPGRSTRIFLSCRNAQRIDQKQ